MRTALCLVALLCLAAGPVRAQIVISANDGKQVLVAGVPTVPAHPAADSVSIIDLNAAPPRIIATLEAPTSVIGPPGSVAVSADGRLALVTAARRLDPADPTKLVPDDVLTVIDLKASPPRAVARLHAGSGASGVAINPAGTLALVANRSEGTVSAFALGAGSAVTPAGKIALGGAASGPSQVVFTPDGRRALVSRDGDNRVSVLDVDGGKVTVQPRDLTAGVRPYGLDIASTGRFAVAANMGGGGTDLDTVSLIDLSGATPRVVDTVTVGLTPEGIKLSPDGRLLAVALHNGSGSPVASPFHSEAGVLQIWRIEGARLVKLTECPMGRWAQGVAWSRDGRRLLAQAMGDGRIEVFGFDGARLTAQGSIATPAGPAGIGSSG